MRLNIRWICVWQQTRMLLHFVIFATCVYGIPSIINTVIILSRTMYKTESCINRQSIHIKHTIMFSSPTFNETCLNRTLYKKAMLEEHVWNQYIFYFSDCFTASTSCVSDLQMKINLNSYNYRHQYSHNDIALKDNTFLSRTMYKTESCINRQLIWQSQ
jgi:hypothetical protein